MNACFGNLFAALKADCPDEWRRYGEHDFVRHLARGTLPEASFRHYLIQDYLFLMDLARAYALAAYKADSLDDMRQAGQSMRDIIEIEMDLHVTYCRGFGLSRETLETARPATQTLAYGRYVLAAGHAGDSLDLHVALAPCVIGYGEIGARLAASPETVRDGNPYAAWIEMYNSDEYQALARAEGQTLDRLASRRIGDSPKQSPRFASLAGIFAGATQLEAAFWDMGLDVV